MSIRSSGRKHSRASALLHGDLRRMTYHRRNEIRRSRLAGERNLPAPSALPETTHRGQARPTWDLRWMTYHRCTTSVGAGLLANAIAQRHLHCLTHRVRQQAGSYRFNGGPASAEPTVVSSQQSAIGNARPESLVSNLEQPRSALGRGQIQQRVAPRRFTWQGQEE